VPAVPRAKWRWPRVKAARKMLPDILKISKNWRSWRAGDFLR
jgi:hypothetical protein